MRILVITVMMSFLSHSAFGAEAGGTGAADGGGGASTVSECLSIPGKNVLVEVMDPSGVLLGRRLETNTDNQREVLGVVVGHISIRNDGPHPRTVEDVIEGDQKYDLTEAQAHGFMEGCVLLFPSNNVCMFCRNGETVVEAVDAVMTLRVMAAPCAEASLAGEGDEDAAEHAADADGASSSSDDDE